VILIGDGMADYPIPERGNRTALQIAYTRNLDIIATDGLSGLARTIPPGMTAGSDIAILSILGYDPAKYHTGRGPLEAMAARIPLGDRDIAFRCNLITENEGRLENFTGGHITTEEAKGLIDELNEEFSGKCVEQEEECELTFYAGIGYRNILVIRHRHWHRYNHPLSQEKEYGFWTGKEIGCAPPHDIVGRRIEDYLPAETILREIMLTSKDVLERHEINTRRRADNRNKANMVWLWSGGKKPVMPAFTGMYGVHFQGSVISDVDLVKGIGRCVGLDAIDIPGATGYFDTDYKAMAEYALRSLEQKDFVMVHVEAPDEAGHLRDIDLKVRTIEDFDELVVGTMLKGLEAKFADAGGGYRILVMPDHYTPVSVGTHTKEPVPFAIYDSNSQTRTRKKEKTAMGSGSGSSFDLGFNEQSARKSDLGVLDARTQELMRLFFKKM